VATIALVLLLPAGAVANTMRHFHRPAEGVASITVGLPADQVLLLWLPPSTTINQLAAAGFSPGLMNAGLGTVPAEQTYLDVTQGDRVFDSLYGEGLPPAPPRGDEAACATWFEAANRRAATAPAEIVPNLLGIELHLHGVAVSRHGDSACAFGGSEGTIGDLGSSRGYFASEEASLAQARSVGQGTGRDGLVIAIARPTGESDDPLPIGIAGRGFAGDLTSDSTRTDGYVLATDVAPTVLAHLGVAIPAEVSGQAITSEGSVDPAAIVSQGERMGVVTSRRGPVIGGALALWVLALLLAIALGRGAVARVGVRLLGIAVVYLPLLLLAASALEPGLWPELALVAGGAAALAALTLAIFPGYRGLGVAAGVTVLAYAIDMIAGSPLTKLSLLGPNPGLGVRLYGIGNELEALLAVLIVAGIGAGLTGFAPRIAPRRAAGAFIGLGLLASLVFAAGRFGADVGAAIVFPVGVAVAAVVVAGGRRRAVYAVIALPFAMVALLALIDLVSGANAHLTRSVLDAGGLNSLGDVAQRRLELSVRSFGRPVLLAFLPLVAILAGLAIWRRRLIAAWLAGRPAMRAGLLGALVATVVGTLANDSGALLLVIGAAYLLVFGGYAWAESGGWHEVDDEEIHSAHHT
jgi:hypothetical protein